MIRTASRGALLGAAAGAVTALGDFGASWLWVPWWLDRLELLGRLLSTQVPMGALGGMLIGLWAAAGARVTERIAQRVARGSDDRQRRLTRRLAPLPLVLLAAPGLAAIAWMLFTGGSASRLPARPVLVAGAFLALASGVWLSLVLGRRLLRWVDRSTDRTARLVGLGVLAVFFAITKIDQHILPGLYGYLHGLLGASAWVVAGLAVHILAKRQARLVAAIDRRPRVGLVAAAALLGVLVASVLTLDENQNVRVALLDTRAPSSRSLMQALAPAVALADSRVDAAAEQERAQRERERRQRERSVDGLPQRPDAHILLITIDALRADHLGLYGYARRVSPTLDRLAAESVVFERAYAQAPHSSYSLCSLMTSEYLHETVDLGQPLPEATLASTLNEAGYHTAAFYTQGIFHTEGERLEAYRDNAFGFARHEHRDIPAEPKTDEVLLEIDRIVGRGEPPSLFWAHYFDVHEPYQDTTFGTSDLDRYDGEIKNADRGVGRLIEQARARLSRPLIVIVTADHGEEFRDHGGVYHGSSLHDEQVRVPLIVHVPGIEPRRVAAPVELVDIAPTALGLAGIAPSPTMRGDDLRPLLAGLTEEWEPAFAGVTYKRMVVRWPYKLIADLRFNLYSVFDLTEDPRELTNLADSRPDLLSSLRGEVYAWLDTLESTDADPYRVALQQGRLRDRRAVPTLGQLVGDEGAPTELRCEAARILGRLSDRTSADALVTAMSSEDSEVAAEAAVSLGRMYDERARPSLHNLVFSEDPQLRARAAVSLGRLRDRAAVPALIDALWVAEDRYDREEAVRWLGRLRDPRAVEPLLNILPDSRMQYLTAVALGQIGDPRAYDALVDMLSWTRHASVRDSVARALGQMGDARAIDELVTLAATEPDIECAGESLVRLDAIGVGSIGGTDVRRDAPGQRGFTDCVEDPEYHDWSYQQRTYCVTRSTRAHLRLAVPDAVAGAPAGIAVLFRARRADDASATSATLTLGDRELGAVDVDGQWHEHRLTIRADDLSAARGRLDARIDTEEEVRLDVDHLLLVPLPGPESHASL